MNILIKLNLNFISSKEAEDEHVMHSRSNKIEFTPYNDANEVVDELFGFKVSRKFRNINERK